MERNWFDKNNNEMTLEDAIQASEEGFDCICENGRLKNITFELE